MRQCSVCRRNTLTSQNIDSCVTFLLRSKTRFQLLSPFSGDGCMRHGGRLLCSITHITTCLRRRMSRLYPARHTRRRATWHGRHPRRRLPPWLVLIRAVVRVATPASPHNSRDLGSCIMKHWSIAHLVHNVRHGLSTPRPWCSSSPRPSLHQHTTLTTSKVATQTMSRRGALKPGSVWVTPAAVSHLSVPRSVEVLVVFLDYPSAMFPLQT